MQVRRRSLFAAAVSTVVGCGAVLPGANAQGYPNRQITLVIPYAAGGTGDIVGRMLAERLTTVLGQSVVVENRAGASGAIGTRAVVSAAPDGHTLLVGQTGEIAITPNWGKGTGYHPDKDLAPVALATVVPLALVSPASAGFATVADLVKAALAAPVTFASAGTGTPGHFSGELLKLRSKSSMAHVPYKGAGPALNDLLGAHVQFFFSGFPAADPHVKAGSLKLLAVSSAKRSASAPDVPAVGETKGLEGFDITLWQGFFAPPGTPAEIVNRLNTEINKLLNEPETKAKLLAQGAEPTPMSVADFAAFTRAEGAKFAGIIKEIGLPAP
jgi:tripartite-type tricarboxylate transporter receptor subunit TctC